MYRNKFVKKKKKIFLDNKSPCIIHLLGRPLQDNR